jgi:uncharacterized protein YbgA (DUF1722 family)
MSAEPTLAECRKVVLALEVEAYNRGDFPLVHKLSVILAYLRRLQEQELRT